jgi:hypothetical protein
MKRIYTSQELAILRDHPQTTQYFLAVHKPKVIARGILNAVPTTYPGNSLSMTSLVNGLSLNDIKAGMTLYIGSEGTKSDYGTLRVRKDYVSGSLIEVGIFGSGLINFQSGACLTVVEDYRIWPVDPAYDTASSRWRVDEVAYTNQTIKYGPQVIMGPAMIGYLDGNTMQASYVGNLSYSHSPGVSITFQRWIFPNGQQSPSALGSSLTPVVVTYVDASPGGAYHSLRVVDGDNNQHTGHRLTFCFGSGVNAPIDCRFEQITGGLTQGGYRTKVYIDEGAASPTIVDGAKVFIFEKSSYGSYGSSIGGNYFARDNIVLAGRVVADSQRIEPFTNSLSFDMESEDGELRRAQGYDVFLESGSAASDWSMASGLTIDKAAIVLAKYRSTIANVMDFNIAGGIATTNEIPFRDLPAGYLWDELKYNYAAEMGMVAVDMQGSLWCMLDSQVTGLSANLSNVMSINKADRRDVVTIDHVHRDVNSQYRLYAIQGGINNPIGAESPGARIGYFGTRQEVSQNLTAISQDQLITWSGNIRARDNNPYKNIVIPLAGNLRIDPVPQSYVTMSLSSTESPRGTNWVNQKIIPTAITLTYSGDNRYATSEIVAETIVNGIGGSAFTFPTAGTIISPPPPPPPVGCPSGYHPDPITGLCVPNSGSGTAGDKSHVNVATYTALGRTANFLAGPNWTAVNPTLVGGEVIIDFLLDPYDSVQTVYLLTTQRLYKTTNYWAGNPPTWAVVFDLTAAQAILASTNTFYRIEATITAQGLIGLCGGISGSNLYYFHTHDGGTTWHGVDTGIGSALAAQMDGFQLSQHDANKLWVTGWNGANTGKVRGSTDGGHTFSTLHSFTEFYAPLVIHVPYAGNPSDLLGYVAGESSSQLYVRSTGNDFSTLSVITPVISGTTVAVTQPQVPASRSILVPVTDANRVFLLAEKWGGGGALEGARVLVSLDAGTTWTQRYQFTISNNSSNVTANCIGAWPWDNSNILYAVGNNVTDGHILYSTDEGFTWVDKIGDWVAAIGAFGTGVQIVPTWLALP